MDDSRAPSRRTSNESPQTPVDSGAAGDTVPGGSPPVRWRVVALGVAAGVPGVALYSAFPELWDLITGLMSLVVVLVCFAATLQGRDGDDLPPASAAFLAAADPTRPLDGSFASADAALAPAAVSPTPQPRSASPTASGPGEPRSGS
jgi:hypothetical protein